MGKFHINKKGLPAPCKAIKGNCPFGGSEVHYESLERAQFALDNKNTQNYKYLPNINVYEVVSKNEISKDLSNHIKEFTSYVSPDNQVYQDFKNKALEHNNFDNFADANANDIVKSEIFEDKDVAESALNMWRQIHLENSSKDLHEISNEQAIQVIQDNLNPNDIKGWFREYNCDYKPRIEQAIITNPKLRNASLNIAHRVYQESTGKQIDFKEFLDMDIDVYRGGNFKFTDNDVFISYSFDKGIAEKFMTKENQELLSRKIKVKDTLGSLQTTGEAEIMIPRFKEN